MPRQTLYSRAEHLADMHDQWAEHYQRAARRAQFAYVADEMTFLAEDHHEAALAIRAAVRASQRGKATEEQSDLLARIYLTSLPPIPEEIAG